ncbi:MAG: mandelate racemase/muconate lactonizing enzyme family protein [Verrucomicrobia bacterium]|nr:mandelate racemase/muconate lactonizing enzyme family protein [Verrucomicrobiota bacterium]
MWMNRREFLSVCGGLSATAFTPAWTPAAQPPQDIKITRIVGFDLLSKRPKLVGKNSRLDVHGDQAGDRMVRVFTNTGLEGIGNCRAPEETLASLLGRNPFDFFKADGRAMRSPLRAGSMPLWDLVGKALGKPVFELLGGQGPRQVPVYDGSIYFADLLPQYAARWQDRFKTEIDQGFQRGHRAFKIKIGRGAKWMPSADGYARDKAVLKAIRQHTGPEVVLGVDANNGYGLGRTKQLLSEMPGLDLAWVEEMFPEVLEENLELKAFLKEQNLKTLIADGETQSSLEPLKPFMEARAIDIYQLDMNGQGLEGILAEAALAAKYDLMISPHNWGSLVGFYMALHIGRAVPNFYRAEHDPLANDVLIADGYDIKNGFVSVPEAPGFGLKINEARFAAAIKPRFDLKS